MCRDPVDDSEPAHAETPKARQLVVQRLARRRVGTDQIEARASLPLQRGMESPEKLREVLRRPETVGLHVTRSTRSVPGQELLQRVDLAAPLSARSPRRISAISSRSERIAWVSLQLSYSSGLT